MMRDTIFYVFAGMMLCMSSCDDGRIAEKVSVPENGMTVRMTGVVRDGDSWHERYDLAVAGFGDDSDYAVVSKVIDISEGEVPVDVSLTGIDGSVSRVELCVLNRLRKRIATFKSVELNTAQESVEIDFGTIDVGMLTTIQNVLFSTTCANCHGATGRAAGSLFLTEGMSRESLVGVPSVKVEGMNRVEPGNAGQSVLYQALTSDISSMWHYNHSSEVTSNDIKTLIADWIDNGAK